MLKGSFGPAGIWAFRGVHGFKRSSGLKGLGYPSYVVFGGFLFLGMGTAPIVRFVRIMIETKYRNGFLYITLVGILFFYILGELPC